MLRFEVGKTYEAAERGYDPITVIGRTAKFIAVTNGNNKWRMKIREGEDAEYAVDSSVPPKWRDQFTYSSKWIYE